MTSAPAIRRFDGGGAKRFALIASSILSIACSDDSSYRPASTVSPLNATYISDSTLLAVRLIQPLPDLVIGLSNRGVHDAFGMIGDIVADSRGNIYILDLYADQIVVFDATGEYTRVVGRRGGGPGEFKNPQHMEMRNDTLFVMDDVLKAFDDEGKFVPAEAHGPGLLAFAEAITSTDSGFVIRRNHRGAVEAKVRIDTLTLYRYFPTGQLEPFMRIADRKFEYSKASVVPIALSMGVIIAVAPDGRVFQVVGDSFHVQIASPSGITTQNIIARVPRTPATRQDYADYIQTTNRMIKDLTRIDMDFATVHKNGPVARERPAIGAMLISRQGQMLIKRVDLSERPYAKYVDLAASEWLLLDVDGQPRVRMTLPAAFEPLVFEGCVLHGIQNEADGPATAVRYNLDASPTSSTEKCFSAVN